MLNRFYSAYMHTLPLLSFCSPRFGKRELVCVLLFQFLSFFFSSLCRRLAAVCDCGTPWTFLQLRLCYLNISSLKLVSDAEQARLRLTWSQTLKTGFLMTRLTSWLWYTSVCILRSKRNATLVTTGVFLKVQIRATIFAYIINSVNFNLMKTCIRMPTLNCLCINYYSNYVCKDFCPYLNFHNCRCFIRCCVSFASQ